MSIGTFISLYLSMIILSVFIFITYFKVRGTWCRFDTDDEIILYVCAIFWFATYTAVAATFTAVAVIFGFTALKNFLDSWTTSLANMLGGNHSNDY